MKRFVLTLHFLLNFTAVLTAAPREAEWKQVEELAGDENVQPVITLLQKIETLAAADKSWPEAAKALGTRLMAEAALEEDHPELKLTRMDAALAKASPEMQTMLQTIQAMWFHDYFSENRWRLMERTQTAGASGADMATWDLRRMLTEVEARFQLALKNADALKKSPVTQWTGLLEASGLPDSYQPTLYDFIARQALAFYTAAEQAAAEAQDAFEFAPDTPALGSMEEFLAWNPGDGTAPKQRAIRLYQSLLNFHKADEDAGARVLLDVERLEWAAAAANGTGADERLLKQLTALYQKHAAHEVSLRARAAAAGSLIKAKKPADAHALLTEGVAALEKSAFAPRCRNLLKQIEQKELSAATELVWNSAGPEIALTYKNLSKVFFRLILVSKQPDPALLADIEDEDRIAKLLRKSPARAWGNDLPPANDFLEQTCRLPAPADLKPGLYLLAVSGNVGFGKKKNQISFAPVWVTPLALLSRVRSEGANDVIEAWVLDAVSGDPVAGAEVTVWSEDEKSKKLVKRLAVPTDADGFASFTASESDKMLLATFGKDTAVSEELSSVRPKPVESKASTFFFTDRAIYRPGQAIQFKGIHVFHDKVKNDYHTLPDAKRHVVLKDMNERELAKLDVVTNAFGSFSGTFNAPPVGITGQLSIQDGNGSTSVQVEEYKRPKFKVELDPPAVAAKLGEAVAVKVKALAYTGAPVDGAEVQWRVVRQAQWPSWRYSMWRFSPGGSGEKEIAHGEAKTAADGTVEVKFTALPDKSVEEKNDPWFRYTVHADVTDTAGETRNGSRTVSAGYTAMLADVSADDWQTAAKPVEFTVHTTTLDAEPAKAAGALTVHRLVQPEKVQRLRLDDEDDDETKDLSDPETWETGEVVQRSDAATNEKGEAKVRVKLAAGAYRAIYEGKDRFGKKVAAQTIVLVINPAAEKFAVKVPFWTGAPSRILQPGDDFNLLWGSGYDRARAFIEIMHRGKVVQRFWTDAARTQQGAALKVKEDHRGGFSVRVTQMRENRLVSDITSVIVPWSNKELILKWEHLTSKLEPGSKDTWTLSLAGPGKEKIAAEVAAVLYDASLDAFTKHEWASRLDCFRAEPHVEDVGFSNEFLDFEDAVGEWYVSGEPENFSLRHWPSEFADSNYSHTGKSAVMASAPMAAAPARGLRFGSDSVSRNAPDALISGGIAYNGRELLYANTDAAFSAADSAPSSSTARKSREAPAAVAAAPNVSARKNMQETAFFFPHLMSAENGTVKMEFTMPEAVTAWRFLGFAHDKKLRSGFIEGETVTAREIMVQPNPPRFLREGDTVEFTVKITNQSDAPQQGTARLAFSDAATLAAADAALGNAQPEQPFEVPAKESRTVSWRITVPDGQGFLTWKATAGTDKISDGEEGWLPVLPRRVLVTESLPLSLSKAGEKTYDFKKLTESAGSETLRHQSLTVQMVSQPAWYAVMALPYLMEFPHECSEQTFNRFYANALARHIAQSDPKIRRTFDLWRDAQPEALESPLLKNPELKSLLIEETPWLRDAVKETEQRRNLGALFDANRLDSETGRVLQQLDQMQLDDGSWPWFPGGHGNDFITLYIVAGFGKLQHLGVEVKTDMAVEALDRLDAWISKEHARALKEDKARKDGREGDHFGSDIALYLYGRSFFLEKRPVPQEQKAATDYFLAQARKYWPRKGRMTQAHAALGLLRFGDKAAAAKILASIKERAVTNEELGRYWADGGDGWRWDAAPVETQALMIEAFRDIAKDSETADECALWLLKQKQMQSWPTTKATADSIYALLLGGTAKLSSDALVSVSLGGAEVKPEKVEAGTGFFEHKFTATEIKADMGAVKLTKTDKGTAWGSVHWQYLEDISKITPHEGTPLEVTKTLFTNVNTAAGPELRPIAGKVKVGDELVVHLELRTDRDMEFVHLKDQRPSSVEPVNVLSEYKWQDGLGYYESTRDTASHFFFDALPKGTYVFEYSARVQLRGQCQAGLAVLQCMYAPEFNSHSAGMVLEVE